MSVPAYARSGEQRFLADTNQRTDSNASTDVASFDNGDNRNGAPGSSYAAKQSASASTPVGSLHADPHDPNTSDRYVLWTPKQALFSRYGKFNFILSAVLSFVINVIAMYASVYPKDYVGTWRTPPTPNPYGLQVWSDWLLVVMCTWAGLGLLSVPGNWANMKFPALPQLRKYMGIVNPIDSEYVTGRKTHWIWKLAGVYSIRPRGWKHLVERTLIFTVLYSGVYYGISMLVIFGMCKAGTVFIQPGNVDPECWWRPTVYIWVKSTWATVFSMIIFPVGLVSGLSVENCPEWGLKPWNAKRLAELKGYDAMAADAELTQVNTRQY